MVLVLEAISLSRRACCFFICKEDLSPFSMPSELHLTSPEPLHSLAKRTFSDFQEKQMEMQKLASGLLPHPQPPRWFWSHPGIPGSFFTCYIINKKDY